MHLSKASQDSNLVRLLIYTHHATPSSSSVQLIDIMIPLGCGGQVYFAQPDALRGSLIFTLREVS